MLTFKVSALLALLYLILALSLFVPAGTTKYKAAWIYLMVFICGTSILTFYFLKTDPQLIERRTHTETNKTQIMLQSVNGLLFVLMLILPGIDFRQHWSTIPFYITLLSEVVVSTGFLIVFIVFKQNTYLASNIKAYQGQRVITTGLYAWVRHPMYSGAYLIILFTPLCLGSYIALLPAIIISCLVVARAINEEKVLARDLTGYIDYLKKVRYRFIPYIF